MKTDPAIEFKVPQITLVFKTSLQSYVDAMTALKHRDDTMRNVSDADKVNVNKKLGPTIYIGDVYKQLNREFQKELVKKVGENDYQLITSMVEYFAQRGIGMHFIGRGLLSINVKGRELRIFLTEQ